MKRKKRVLVLEDEQDWINDLTAALESGGYQVAVAANIKDAEARLQEDFYHFLSVDISMIPGDGSNDEGLQWLGELCGQGMNQSLAIIVLTGWGYKQRMRTAFSLYKVADFLDKDDYTDEIFLHTVEQVFREHVKINLDLEMHWQGRKPEQILINLEFEGRRLRKAPELLHRLVLELDDLLCRLFHHAKSLIIESPESGHGRGAVLKVQPEIPNAGVPQAVIVKFGEAALIDREHSNFKEYVEHFVGGARSTSVKGLRRTQKLGGIVYSFLGGTGDRFESLGEMYRRADAAQIKNTLDHLFQETCGRWYSNLGTIHHHNLTQDYQQLLGFDWDKLEGNREDLKSVQGRERLLFEDLTRDRKFTNPIRAARDQEIVKSTYSVVTHGDLNENNILIDPVGNTWLIDFAFTGRGHILRDVAKLDSVVRFQLLAETQATLEERLAMEEALCGLIRFSDIEQLPLRFASDNPSIAKTFEISSHLLARARKLVGQNPHDDIGEYYAALLFNALNTLRFYSVPNLQRQHALLSACLLADRLGLRA